MDSENKTESSLNRSPSFQLKIASTGEVIEVPEDKSILQALDDSGYHVERSCSNGLCGACKTPYLQGEPDHKDMILSGEEQSQYLTVCVSRSKTPEIVLDLPDPATESLPATATTIAVAVVNSSLCVGCLTCVRICPFEVPRIDAELAGVGSISGVAVIEEAECRGCGVCVAACPAGAIAIANGAEAPEMPRLDQFLQIKLAETTTETTTSDGQLVPEIVVFSCHNCAEAIASQANEERLAASATVEVVAMPCSGRIDKLHLLKAFEAGADGVIVAGCPPGRCHFQTGNIHAKQRVERVHDWLQEIGLAGDRIKMVNLSAEDTAPFVEVVTELGNGIKTLGLNSLKIQKRRNARLGME